MTALEYLKKAVTSSDLDVSTEFRTTSRGVVITPRSFEVAKVYGQKQRIMAYRVSLTLAGECVANGELFDTMETLTAAFLKDQTAGGSANEVLVDQWNSVEMDKNYTVFETHDKFRVHRVCGPGVGTRLVLRLERATASPPPGSRTLAVVDPLNSEQRTEVDRLTAELADILRRDGREDDIAVLDTPLADVVLLDDASAELAARAGDARRLATLRSITGDRYTL